MPIQINLLAETLAEEDLRRRDPVRRSIYVGFLLVALSLVWYSSVWLQHIIAGSNLTQIEATIQDHNNDYNQVVDNLKKIADAHNRLDALHKLSAARFLQGTFLNSLQQLYTPNVQLTHLKLDQSYMHKSTAGTQAIPASSSVTEHIVLTLDARDFSPNPGDQVNHFKGLFGTQDYFKSRLDTNNAVSLVNLSPPQIMTDGKPYVMFTLECHFPDVNR